MQCLLREIHQSSQKHMVVRVQKTGKKKLQAINNAEVIQTRFYNNKSERVHYIVQTK